jgi:hypothetical protein
VHYVSNLEAAVRDAKHAAGDKNVLVHGASIAQRALTAGLLDEFEIHLIPVLLGDGRRLFEHPGIEQRELERVRAPEGEGGVTPFTIAFAADGSAEATCTATNQMRPWPAPRPWGTSSSTESGSAPSSLLQSASTPTAPGRAQRFHRRAHGRGGRSAEKVGEQSIGRLKGELLKAGKTALAAGTFDPSTREEDLVAEVC